jgi:hypothetical protein
MPPEIRQKLLVRCARVMQPLLQQHRAAHYSTRVLDSTIQPGWVGHSPDSTIDSTTVPDVNTVLRHSSDILSMLVETRITIDPSLHQVSTSPSQASSQASNQTPPGLLLHGFLHTRTPVDSPPCCHAMCVRTHLAPWMLADAPIDSPVFSSGTTRPNAGVALRHQSPD